MGDTRVRRLRLAVVALFVLSAVGLATVEPDEPGGVFVSAAAATKEQGTAAFSMSLTMQITGAPVTNAGEGRVDFGTGNGTFAFRSPPSELILHDGTTYTRTAGAAKWIAVDARRFGRQMPTAGLAGGPTDPIAMLEALEKAGVASNVRQEGTDTVRGVATTKWTADIDAEKLVSESSDRDVLRALQIKTFRYGIWVDDEHLARRVTMSLQAATMSTDITMEFFDFGIPVTVAPPPADQVMRIPTGG